MNLDWKLFKRSHFDFCQNYMLSKLNFKVWSPRAVEVCWEPVQIWSSDHPQTSQALATRGRWEEENALGLWKSLGRRPALPKNPQVWKTNKWNRRAKSKVKLFFQWSYVANPWQARSRQPGLKSWGGGRKTRLGDWRAKPPSKGFPSTCPCHQERGLAEETTTDKGSYLFLVCLFKCASIS